MRRNSRSPRLRRRGLCCSRALAAPERDMEALWQANVEVICAALQASQLAPAQIRGVACAGHGKLAVPVRQGWQTDGQLGAIVETGVPQDDPRWLPALNKFLDRALTGSCGPAAPGGIPMN